MIQLILYSYFFQIKIKLNLNLIPRQKMIFFYKVFIYKIKNKAQFII